MPCEIRIMNSNTREHEDIKMIKHENEIIIALQNYLLYTCFRDLKQDSDLLYSCCGRVKCRGSIYLDRLCRRAE